ncbi:hypothetical protein [Sinanaerobacter chloroacetimidivorans]|uniref:Acetylglutamate kinase n=1 Tax=Sinanaerobacter chloroacetimidivorans TaxID=2818044 RepID=A0A8J8B003_9FIRM|nr:hypothetical protein [Sinanaerobacter chloroacetimidivorans]MBR0597083.1 hypothetical protein [Sinanaerobacter chloroacetimidivorans]
MISFQQQNQDEIRDRQRYTISDAQLNLMNALRQTWGDLSMWTRAFLVSTAAGLGDAGNIRDRLAQIPDAFASELSHIYEPEQTNQLRDLLNQHILLMEALITAEKNGDDVTVNQSTVRLYQNADNVASFLSSVNPYWEEEKWKDLLDDYLEMNIAQMVARLGGNFSEDIIIYNSIEKQAMQMADYMSEGIIQRFNI